MTYIELQAEVLDAESIGKFWGKHQEGGFAEVSLNADTETGSFVSTERDWANKLNLPAIGIRLNVVGLASRWNKLAESDISDKKYEELVEAEAADSLRVLLQSCPSSIVVHKSTIDDE